jgi:uncharacterized membrane protein
MIHAEDILFMNRDFNLETTLIENLELKKSNQTLKTILVMAAITIIGVLIANIVVKRLEEESKQRV